ncbi:MAG: hypothetical protein ABIN80_05085 [Dyadobacter sp.]|uniref:hypothetical protein n=1 Tax=Dyadobacter sp. TaxID=1914288 RepID=UPI003263926B
MKKFDQLYVAKHNEADIQELNFILNTYHDIEYAKQFLFNNLNIYNIEKDHRFFLNMGHCFHEFWNKAINTVASTIDREFSFLPKTNEWRRSFEDLANHKVDGFYIESTMSISPIGIRAIFEGQASFNQMQYLTLTLDEDLSYSDFKDQGLLHGIYLEAFELFLTITKYEKPESLLEPVVGLFLILCDIAINPTNGFPIEIYDYENFIYKNDPGIRFTNLCNAIHQSEEDFLNMITDYSKDEYIEIESILCEKIGCKSSYRTIETVLDWCNNDSILKLLEEEQNHSYVNYNFPVRVLFSKYIRFQEDKFIHPNIFCWFGIYGSSRSKNVDFDIVNSLFNKHHALFIDDYDDEVKPVMFEGKNENAISQTFNAFFQYSILFDMVNKWVSEEGEFSYDYKWLSNKPVHELTSVIIEDFKQMFGIYPDELIILKDDLTEVI